MARKQSTLTMELMGAEAQNEPDESGGEMLHLLTSEGDILCRLHRRVGKNESPEMGRAIVWVFGAGGGLGGPAGGLYERMAQRFRVRGVSSLQIAYRRPGQLESCVLDTLAGAAFLETLGLAGGSRSDGGRIVLVGHSFGGAVVITAGTMLPHAAGVAALSSQTFGTEEASRLSPVPLFLAHGEADEILPLACSQDIFRRAKEPKELILYPDCRHGLDECRESLDYDLTNWLERVLL